QGNSPHRAFITPPTNARLCRKRNGMATFVIPSIALDYSGLLGDAVEMSPLSGSENIATVGLFPIVRMQRSVVHRPDGGLSAVMNADLAKNSLDVHLYGCFRNLVLARDRFVGFATHQMA